MLAPLIGSVKTVDEVVTAMQAIDRALPDTDA